MNNKTSDIIYAISPNPSAKFLYYRNYYLERDIYRIASIVFNIETAIRLGRDLDIVEIPISVESFNRWPIQKIQVLLNELIKFVTYRSITINLVMASKLQNYKDKNYPIEKIKNICLFSGGIDSTTGLAYLLLKSKIKVAAVFACHSDQGKIGSVIDQQTKIIEKLNKFTFHKIHIPNMYSVGYSQLRGFLYVICGGIFAHLHKAENVFVTECGPTMYQIRFSPFDSITMTTHPKVLSFTKALLEMCFEQKIEMIIPFENLTKAEVAILNPIPETLITSHSCIGSRWIISGKNGRHANDGVCYGCVIRRLGLITAGLQDAIYEKDPLLDAKSNSDSLQNILAYSTEVILDYDGIDYFSKDTIETYKKRGLYRRFALDNIAALHLLINEGKKLNPKIIHHYNDVKNNIGTKVLDDRIKEVRGMKNQPNFNRRVE